MSAFHFNYTTTTSRQQEMRTKADRVRLVKAAKKVRKQR